jgi:hypothetical protein
VTEKRVGRARHSWGDPIRRTYHTERCCRKCAIVKITRHEPGVLPWVEFERDGARIDSARTPPCDGGGAN